MCLYDQRMYLIMVCEIDLLNKLVLQRVQFTYIIHFCNIIDDILY